MRRPATALQPSSPPLVHLNVLTWAAAPASNCLSAPPAHSSCYYSQSNRFKETPYQTTPRSPDLSETPTVPGPKDPSQPGPHLAPLSALTRPPDLDAGRASFPPPASRVSAQTWRLLGSPPQHVPPLRPIHVPRGTPFFPYPSSEHALNVLVELSFSATGLSARGQGPPQSSSLSISSN